MRKVLNGKIKITAKKPLFIISVIIIFIFCIESLIMKLTLLRPEIWISKYDSLILSILTFPLLICMVYKPFKRYLLEKEQLDINLCRLEELNHLGQLASVIAHEVRNPMTTVKGYLQLLSTKDLYLNDKEIFQMMIDEIDRGNSIITEFLLFSKNKVYERKLTNLNDIISTILPLLTATATHSEDNVVVDLQNVSNLWLDHGEIKQLIVNLFKNALEAIKPGDKIIIRTYENVDGVFFEVEDNGPGIPKEILNELGTPFFTTKETGTGLGLAVCYSIIARYKGHIDINSSSLGTKVRVYFPLKYNHLKIENLYKLNSNFKNEIYI